MKKILLIFSFIFIVSHNAYSDHIKDGEVYFCTIDEHKGIFLNSQDQVYPHHAKKFKFKIETNNENGGKLIFSDSAQKDLLHSRVLDFKFDKFHNDKDISSEETTEIRGFHDYGSFSFDKNTFASSSSFAWQQVIEYFFATCDKF